MRKEYSAYVLVELVSSVEAVKFSSGLGDFRTTDPIMTIRIFNSYTAFTEAAIARGKEWQDTGRRADVCDDPCLHYQFVGGLPQGVSNISSYYHGHTRVEEPSLMNSSAKIYRGRGDEECCRLQVERIFPS